MTAARSASPASVEHDRSIRILHSRRVDGDFHIEQPTDVLHRARRRLLDVPWTQTDQRHGTTVLVVDRPGAHDGAVADGLVCGVAGAALAIWTGDCAPVALIGSNGWFGAVHAGWRGIERGVLAAAVDTLRQHDPGPVRAVLGPCIHPCCYEFGADDLRRLEDRFGPSTRAQTIGGSDALDVPAAVRAALAEVGVPLDDRSDCTGCAAGDYFSHRVRAERERQVMLVWRDQSQAGEPR